MHLARFFAPLLASLFVVGLTACGMEDAGTSGAASLSEASSIDEPLPNPWRSPVSPDEPIPNPWRQGSEALDTSTTSPDEPVPNPWAKKGPAATQLTCEQQCGDDDLCRICCHCKTPHLCCE